MGSAHARSHAKAETLPAKMKRKPGMDSKCCITKTNFRGKSCILGHLCKNLYYQYGRYTCHCGFVDDVVEMGKQVKAVSNQNLDTLCTTTRVRKIALIVIMLKKVFFWMVRNLCSKFSEGKFKINKTSDSCRCNCFRSLLHPFEKHVTITGYCQPLIKSSTNENSFRTTAVSLPRKNLSNILYMLISFGIFMIMYKIFIILA